MPDSQTEAPHIHVAIDICVRVQLPGVGVVHLTVKHAQSLHEDLTCALTELAAVDAPQVMS